MRVTNLEVEAYRNLKPFQLHPHETANIICGDNAQGKTNLLEAIWLFTGSKSFRGNKEKDFIPKGGDFAGLSFDFEAGGREQKATIRWAGDKRVVTLNGVKQDNPSAFAGVFCGVIFSPDHLSLIKDGPDNRRQMIDASLLQAYPKYGRALLNYQKALKQRNTLLKDSYYNSSLLDLLELWDLHIVNYGGYITALRDRYIRKLAEYSRRVYEGIAGGREELKISYLPSFGKENTDGYELKDFQRAIETALAHSRSEDLRLGNTTIGPHRDDLEIEIDGLSARTFGSQGQQRSAILALKLAECSILEEQFGEPPVVMLDDVMSELDAHRRSYLLNKLENKQVFITCCEPSAFSELTKGKVFYIGGGEVLGEEEKGVVPCIST